MKYHRVAILLLALALVFGFLYWYLGIRNENIDERFDFLYEDDKIITKLILTVRGEIPLVIERKKSEITHNENRNDEWIISSPIETTADKYVIQTLIRIIKGIEGEQIMQNDLEKMNEYGLDDPLYSIHIYYQDEEKAHGIDFGLESLDGERVFVNILGKNKIYSLPTHIRDTMKLNLIDVRDKYLCNYMAADIRSLTLVSSESSFFIKKESNGWYLLPENRMVSDKNVQNYIGRLRWIRFVEVIEEVGQSFSKYGLDRPKLVLVLEIEDENDFSFIVGDSIIENNGDFFYATRSSDGIIFKVKSELIYDIVNSASELIE